MVDLEGIRRRWKEKGAVAIHYRGAPRPDDLLPLMLEVERLGAVLSVHPPGVPDIRTLTPVAAPGEVPQASPEVIARASKWSGSPLSRARVTEGLDPARAQQVWVLVTEQFRLWGLKLSEDGGTTLFDVGGREPDLLDELLGGERR